MRKLTRRQLDILNCLSLGLSDTEIAKRLGTTRNTVKTHSQRIYAVMDLPDNRHRRVIMAQWWISPLFREGLYVLGGLKNETSH